MSEKTISRKTIYEGRIVKLHLDNVALANGKQATREVVEHSGAAAILALNKQKEAYFVKQFRKPVEKELWEIPAGKLEPGESPLACAQRELAEEVGLKANDFRLLSAFYTSPGFASEKIYVYLATGLSVQNEAQPDEDEILEVFLLPLAEAKQMISHGEIEDAKTIVAVLLAVQLGLA
ncbi:MAG TPA: NUDIX hydrolase [Oscillospiraceae bacterium]|nr:NUDIX hydrolase [Oscillospiraceae bacterium]